MGDNEAIFLRNGDKLTMLRETQYQTEAVLQDALTQFPEVIAGVTTSGDAPVGLLLIKAEKSIKHPTDAAMRLDHLFVDAAGVPVLVEVKRSSDRRIYREVVGQLLEYASNGPGNWPPGSLRADFERRYATGRDADDQVRAIVADVEVDAFWARVDENIRDGRIRLIVVADRLPAGVVRIIEFLNEQMRDTEVLGVEVAQYINPIDPEGVVYVPRLRGQTHQAQTTKTGASGVARARWDRTEFIAETAARNPGATETLTLVNRLLDDAAELHWGSGGEPGVGGWYDIAGKMAGVWELYGGGTTADRPANLTIALNRLQATGVDHEEVAERLKKLPSFAAGVETWQATSSRRQPNGKLDQLAGDPGQVHALFAILRDVIRKRDSSGAAEGSVG